MQLTSGKTALIIVRTNVGRDPRVRRQLDWLASEGWVVDTLGLGEHPGPPARDHFGMSEKSRWFRSKIALGLVHLLPYKQRFHALSIRRMPGEAIARVKRGEYDLIVFNDTHLTPWLGDSDTFGETHRAHIHLDLHEYFPAELPSSTRGRVLLNGYYKWGRNFIAHPLIDTRSVAAPTSERYAAEFNIPLAMLVRNCPPYVQQNPSPIDPNRIELIHHGVAAWRRGFKEMAE